MNVTFLVSLSLAALALLLLESFGLIGGRELKLKGDIKRETRWLAQYGQGTCVLVAALLVWQLDPRRLPRSGYLLTPAVMLTVGTFGTAFLTGILKRLVGRVRPNRENAGKFPGTSLTHQNWRESFPSMHSASAIAFTVLMARLYPAAGIVFWTLAAVCATLRYVLNAHWPSDVVAGCAMGYGLGSWAWVYWGGQAAAGRRNLDIDVINGMMRGQIRWIEADVVRYDLSTVADHLGQVLQQAEADLRLEQAVYGLDSLDELRLQSLLATGLTIHYEVAREVHYPSSSGNKRTHRARCDLVLSPKCRPLKRDFEPVTLFDSPDLCPPSEALWLEVKAAYQFREGGIRHGGYGTQWRNAVVEDLRKMEVESSIREAALVLIVFNESPEILNKDLDLFEMVLIQKEVLAGFRQVRSFPVLDRIGHRLCTVALWPTVQREAAP